MSEITEQPEPETHGHMVGYGIAVGATLGFLIGLLLGNLIMGIALERSRGRSPTLTTS